MASATAHWLVPRFYFHLHDDMDVPDDLGVDLPSLEAAVAYAVDQIRHLAGEMLVETGRVVLTHQIDIQDRCDVVLCTVKFADAIKIED